jgi:hypothetical protein
VTIGAFKTEPPNPIDAYTQANAGCDTEAAFVHETVIYARIDDAINHSAPGTASQS